MRGSLHTMVRLAALAALFTLTTELAAQDSQNAKLRHRAAKQHERAGDYEAAVVIYEALYEAWPKNGQYFNALKGAYMTLGRYDDLIELIEEGLTRRRGDMRLRAELGDAYYKSGRVDEAQATWDEIIASHPKNPRAYKSVAAMMIQNRLFDQATLVYQMAQEKVREPGTFMLELAALHVSRMSYAAAAEEYVSYLVLDSHNYERVKRALARLPVDSTVAAAVLRVLRNRANEVPVKHPVHRLVADYQFKNRLFSEALAAYEVLDSTENAHGKDLFKIGEQLKQEGELELARRAFEKVLDREPARTLTLRTLFSLAETQEELERREGTKLAYFTEPITFKATEGEPIRVPEQPSYTRSIALYDSLAQLQPRSVLAGQARLRIGEILFERLQDYDGAIAAFRSASGAQRAPEIHDIAMLRIADVYLARGELVAAEAQYRRMAATSSEASLRDWAHFSLARLAFYEGEFDSASARLDRFIRSVKTDNELLNNALELRLLLEEHQNRGQADEEALKLFARAELSARQRKLAEATALFEEVARKMPEFAVADDALLRAAELWTRMGRYDEALAVLEALSSQYPESPYQDEVLVRTGEIYEYGLNDPSLALYYYERLLEEHPKSLFVEAVRTKIRTLVAGREHN